MAQAEGGYVSPLPFGAGAPPSEAITATTTGISVVGDLTAGDDVIVGDDLTVAGLATIGETLAVTGILSGFMKTASRTATSDGLTTGTIADAGALQFVTVSSSSANDIIVLPTPTPGTIVILRNGATGYELRSSSPNTVAINGGTGSAGESAIAASTMVIAVCTTATTWQAIGLAGTTLAAVEAAAN